MSSAVGFLASPADAGRELALLRSSRTGRCLSSYIDEQFTGHGDGAVRISPVTITQGVPPAPGTTGGFGWRINAPLRVHGLAVSYYMDVLGFVYGQAEVRLTSSGLLIPFPAAAQEELYGLLLSRARAHVL